MFLKENTDFYDILFDRDEYVIVPSKTGKWVTAEDFTNLMNMYVDTQLQLEETKAKLHKQEETLKSLLAKKQLNVVKCPRCKSIIEDDDMRRKHCHVCHFEWERNIGY